MITIHQIDNFRYIDELRPKPTRELLRQSVEQFVATDRPKTASAEDLTDELSDICEDAIFEERQREANMEMVLQQLKSTFERRQCDILIRPKSYTEADDYVPLGCAKLMGLGDGQHGEETLYCAVSVQPCKKAGPLKSAWMALNGAFSWAFNRTY